MKVRVAYWVSRFPKTSETFIVDEITALEEAGVEVALYALAAGHRAIVGPEAARLDGRCHRLAPLSPRLVGAEHTIIGSETVKRLHDQGIAIGTHTLFPIGSTTGKPISPSAMTAADVERLVDLGVDWIESDDPERLMRMIA